MGFSWTNDIAVGVPSIDDQHKILIQRVNDLFDACGKGKGRDEVAKHLDFLSDYTIKHFADEEKYMLSINYPAYAQQKQMHIGFMKEVSKLKEELSKNGASIGIVSNANSMVTSWLMNHIKIEDKKIGEYAKQKK